MKSNQLRTSLSCVIALGLKRYRKSNNTISFSFDRNIYFSSSLLKFAETYLGSCIFAFINAHSKFLVSDPTVAVFWTLYSDGLLLTNESVIRDWCPTSHVIVDSTLKLRNTTYGQWRSLDLSGSADLDGVSVGLSSFTRYRYLHIICLKSRSTVLN